MPTNDLSELRLSVDMAAWLGSPLPETSSVLVAVSGGADSVALLRAMVAPDGDQEAGIVVGHVNHGLREAESDEDAAWVVELAGSLGVRCEVTRVELGEKVSEEAARRHRYEALTEMAVRHDCRAVAVAHTRDDQVETVLHHLLRGTGLKGLAGMSARQPLQDGLELWRPLLEVSREMVEGWLESLGQSWREDATNRQTRWTRNRIRHELLPVLEREYNPQVRDALVRVARLSSEALGIVEEAVRQLSETSVLQQTPSLVRLNIDSLAGVPEPMIRALVMDLWCRQGWPRQGMGFSHWNGLAGLVAEGTAVDLPGGVTARRNGSVLRIERILCSDR
jgi:tRNA(Ile)-lysidine synthase